MSNQLVGDYLGWLEPQFRDHHYGDPNRTYEALIGLMWEKEYVWLVANDDNRLIDGLDLRAEFCHDRGFRTMPAELTGPCSFLEVLIGLSRRLSFNAGGDAPIWAWQLVNNLGLHRRADPMSRRHAREVDEILDAVIFRTYQPDGGGGFFPLNGPAEDQRKIELWYQMSAYIDEIHPEH